MASRSAQMAQVARLNQLIHDAAVRQAELDYASRVASSARSKLDVLKTNISEAARGMGLGALVVPQPAQLEDWLVRRRRALESVTKLTKHARNS